MPEVDMKNEKTQTMPQFWFTKYAFIVNDLVAKMTKWHDDDDDEDDDDDNWWWLMMMMVVVVARRRRRWWWWLWTEWVNIYMKSKLKEYLGMTLLSLSFIVTAMQLHSASLLFQLYSYNTVPWINHRIALLITDTSKSLELQLFFLLKVMWKQWHLMDHCILALSYLSDTLTLFLQTIARGNMEEQTQCMKAKDLPPSLCIALVIKIHHHFGSIFLLDSLHEHQICSSDKEVQKYECSFAVAKCWHTMKSVQSICCWRYWPQLGDTRLPTHSMESVLLHMSYWVGPQSGDHYAELWKWMSYKQLVTTTFAIVWLFLWG